MWKGGLWEPGFDGGAVTSDAGGLLLGAADKAIGLVRRLAGKLEAWRLDCAPVAGKSTLNRLELSRAAPTKYAGMAHDPGAIEGLFVDLFIEAHAKAPKQITLDLAATDDAWSARRNGPAARPIRGSSSPR